MKFSSLSLPKMRLNVSNVSYIILSLVVLVSIAFVIYSNSQQTEKFVTTTPPTVAKRKQSLKMDYMDYE
jgi:hypothetical protein